MHFTVVFVIIGLLILGLILTIYGTIAKNKWGINTQRVFCPRCKTRLPVVREAQSLRQAWWGGWTCGVCGTEVDKWGREIVHVGPSSRARTPVQVRSVVLKRVTFVFIPLYFCITLLLRWPDPQRGFTFSGVVAFLVVGTAILETAIVTLILYFGMSYLFKRLFSEKKEGNSAGGG